MRAVEYRRPEKDHKERRAKPARRSLAFYSPRPPLLRDSTKESMIFCLKPKPSEGDFIAAIRGSVADAFFGASPVVASALGIRLGATPRGRLQPNMPSTAAPEKGDILIWQRRGHFHLALTRPFTLGRCGDGDVGTVVPIRRRFSVQGEGSRHKRAWPRRIFQAPA